MYRRLHPVNSKYTRLATTRKASAGSDKSPSLFVIRVVMKCIEEHELKAKFPTIENLQKRLENLEKKMEHYRDQQLQDDTPADWTTLEEAPSSSPEFRDVSAS
ncbi:hypothetical protein KSP39_PZI004257 [Platanthera zijinensis]|uniref:FRIGIDA-like protein n=1 Tax=Platanthera zijinensis TaxID=2320716 RepID=A0AAP0GCJ4_9ASPA